MRRLFLAAAGAAAFAPGRADAFWCHRAYPPVVGYPPVVFAPVWPTPVAFAPECCGPAAIDPPPVTGPAPTPAPPRVERMPAEAAPSPAEIAPKPAEPSPKPADPGPAAPAVPRPAVPPPDPLDTPRPKDKTSDGLPVPKPALPTTPPATDPQFPPLKLTPPGEGESSVSFARPPADPRADVYPVAGPARGPLTAGFHNRTDRPVSLTVGGETVNLPARHSVSARVDGGFVWRLDGGPERAAEVPAGSAGVEVVIR